ncbi:MAG: dihydrodipicolinate synthase family protein [Ginsengibacter sp.]
MAKILSDISGVVPILPTPFNTDESIDESGFETILAFAKAAGCTTVGLPAFGSEFYKLSGEERNTILDIVFKYADGLKIIVQCNHASPKVVEVLIKDAENRGASAINTALPRAMPVSESQLFKYAGIVCSSTTLPVIIQDYNPGGPIIGLDFVKRLSNEFENFKFIKYEVPGIGPLIKDILNNTHEKVKVFSGWGGSYMMEQIPAGIAGIMPGIPLADYFVKLWGMATSGNTKDAMKMFASIAAYLSFSLQNLEMFHHAEKKLAVRRGIIKSAVVRSVSIELDSFQEKYLELLLNQTCDAIEQYGLKLKA